MITGHTKSRNANFGGEVFEHELAELHKAQSVHLHIKRPSNLTGLAFDNISLINEGLRSQAGENLFEKFRTLEQTEMEEFREHFLNR